MSLILDGTLGTSIVQSGCILQASLANNVVGNGPAFSAFLPSSQTVSTGVATKVALTSKDIDTSNAFDNVTNYRFLPLVSGYYQVNASVQASATATTQMFLQLYKNGSPFRSGGSISTSGGVTGAWVVQLNGTSDYVELWGSVTGTTPVFVGSSTGLNTSFSASMIRSA